MTGLPDRRTLVGVAFAALLLAAAVPVAVVVAPGLVGADASYVVASDSMSPTLSTGDVLLTAAIPPEEVRAGDVVTYRTGSDDERTTHRVVEVIEEDGEYYYRTRGDADESANPRLVPASALEGRMVLVVPRVGYLFEFAKTDVGIAAFVVLSAGLLVVEGRSFARSFRGEFARSFRGESGREFDGVEDEQPDVDRA